NVRTKTLDDALQAVNKRPQSLRNDHRAVGLLIILKDGKPSAADCQTRAVQGVHKLGLRSTGAAKANVGAPRLERFVVRAGRDFAKGILRRQPHFDVVSLGVAETKIAG